MIYLKSPYFDKKLSCQRGVKAPRFYCVKNIIDVLYKRTHLLPLAGR